MQGHRLEVDSYRSGGRRQGEPKMSGLMGCRGIWVAGLVIAPGLVLGHHSRFEYDGSEVAEVQGTVQSVFWRNPHIRFVVEAGETRWEMEGGPVNGLERAGIERDVIQVGDRVTVLGLVSKRSQEAMLPIRLTHESGEHVVLSRDRAEALGLLGEAEPVRTLGSEAIELARREADGIFRVWTNLGRTQTRSSHPLTAAARAAKESWDQPRDDLALRCVQAGMPEAMVSPFPIEIIDEGDRIVMRLEEWDNVRVIHLSASEETGSPTASPLGHSVGRWDGRDLVVRTTHINYPFLDDRGTPQSEAVEIEERFILSADATRLDWTARVVDENTFTEPTTLPMMHWEWVPGEQIKPYNCTLNEG